MEGTYMPIKFILHSLCMCLTLCDPMNGSLPGSFVCGILQARILHGLPCPSPAHLPDPGIEPTSPQSPALAPCTSRWILYHCATWRQNPP